MWRRGYRCPFAREWCRISLTWIQSLRKWIISNISFFKVILPQSLPFYFNHVVSVKECFLSCAAHSYLLITRKYATSRFPTASFECIFYCNKVNYHAGNISNVSQCSVCQNFSSYILKENIKIILKRKISSMVTLLKLAYALPSISRRSFMLWNHFQTT